MTRAELVEQVEASRRQNPDADGRRITIQKGEKYITVRSDGQGYLMFIGSVSEGGVELTFFYLGHLQLTQGSGAGSATPKAGLMRVRVLDPQGKPPTAAVEDAAAANDADPPTTPAEGNSDGEADEYTAPITVFGRALDVQGKPIAEGEIFLASRQPGHKRLAQTTSAADGSYRFEDVSLSIKRPDTNAGRNAGSFEVFGIAEGYALAWRPKKSFYPDRKHVLDTWGDSNRDQPPGYGTEDPIELDLTFGPPKTIRGRIVDERGQPIPDTGLAIRSCRRLPDREDDQRCLAYGYLESLNGRAIVPPRVKIRTTGADGRFEFTGLPADYRWSIDVRPPGHPPRVIHATTHEGIDSDANGIRVYSGDFDVVFASPRKLKIRVVYGDTGEPAPKVGVGGMVTVAGFFETTDEDGFVEALLPDGRHQLGMIPRYGTPYLSTQSDVVASAETAQQTTTLRLRPAAVVDVSVVDGDTGKPLSGVDVWLDQEVPGATKPYRRVHGYRSWEVETRISHSESPRSDANGKMRVLFEPGKHRIGVALEAFPEGYEPVQPDGKEVDCQPGEPISVEFRMRRKRTATRTGASSPLSATAQPEAEKVPPKPTQKFELHVVGPDGKAVPHAEVEIRAKPLPAITRGELLERDKYGLSVKADVEGRLLVEIPAKPNWFKVRIEEPGYGPYWASWDSERHSMSIPAKFTAELEDAWTVGGVVVDSDGNPIPGVSVDPSIEPKQRPGSFGAISGGKPQTTDGNGRWSYSSVPSSISEVFVEIAHPDYKPNRRPLTRSEFGIEAGHEPKARITLKRGLEVTGTVSDELGQPILGALVRTKFLNDIREARTDERGVYRLVGCEPRMARIVVSAEGRATDMKELRLDQEMDPVDFRMQPGGKVRIRVLDEQGNPVPKARIFFQRWRGRFKYFEFDHVDQFADENGVWEWNEAPLDEFKADICRPHGMQLARQSLIARDEEYVFRVPAALVISGKVIDAETKEPIKTFRVVWGIRSSESHMNWVHNEGFTGNDGQYSLRRTLAYFAHLVRIEADGYLPAVSRDIKSNEGNVSIDFELSKGEDVAATVLTPDGAPAAGAKVALGVAGSQISVQNGSIDDGSTYSARRDTDQSGQFSFPPRDTDFQLVITHPSGYAYIKPTPESMPTTIRLEAWAQVEGTFRVGPKPVANVPINIDVSTLHSRGDKVPNIFTHHDVTTGLNGRFVFERVIPGSGYIRRRIMLTGSDGAADVTSSCIVAAKFPAGETVHIDLGGAGRPVVGKLKPPEGLGEKVNWNFVLVNVESDLTRPKSPSIPTDIQTDPEKRKAWWQKWSQTEEGKAWNTANEQYNRLRAASPRFTASVDRDGTFRIDDVPSGNYSLDVRFQRQPAGRLRNHRFSVAPIDGNVSADPIDLGDLQLKTVEQTQPPAKTAPSQVPSTPNAPASLPSESERETPEILDKSALSLPVSQGNSMESIDILVKAVD